MATAKPGWVGIPFVIGFPCLDLARPISFAVEERSSRCVKKAEKSGGLSGNLFKYLGKY